MPYTRGHGRNLQDYVPEVEYLLELEPEEIGLAILRTLNARPDHLFHGGSFANEFAPGEVSAYSGQRAGAAQEAVLEGWAWLVSQGLIAPAPGNSAGSSGVVFVTRRGKRITSEEAVADYRKASQLSWQLIHSTVVRAARASFIRGDFQNAVFLAFKEVEIAVRAAGGFDDTDVGTDLMRRAFDHQKGPLRDATLPKAEREALAHLAAGAIGSYKNPHSHRTVTLSDPTDAAEMIFLASHLLRIVEARKPD